MLGSDRTFAREFPEEWRHIGQRRRGQLLTGNGLFTFATVSPHPVAHAAARSARTDLATPADALESPYAWKIIARLPPQDLVPSPARFLADHIALYGAMLALGSFLLARARVHHHQAELHSDYERRFRRTLEDIQLAAVALDKAGRITFCNRFLLALTDWSRTEVAGQNPRVLKSGETAPGEYSELWRTVSAGGEWRGEFHNRRKNGELYWESASISALSDAQGRITHYLAVKEDITERKRLEQEVESRNRELARAQALAEVGRMATMIAHDLRNPLSSVVGLTQRRLDEQRITLEARYQSGLPTFPGDPNQLRQVFSNLFINAIQATEDLPEGERRISISTGLELASEGTRIRIEICDNGRGIDARDYCCRRYRGRLKLLLREWRTRRQLHPRQWRPHDHEQLYRGTTDIMQQLIWQARCKDTSGRRRRPDPDCPRAREAAG